MLNGTLGINFAEILIEIQTFSFKKMHLKMSSGKWHPFCLSLNVLLCMLYDPWHSNVKGPKVLFRISSGQYVDT